MPSNRFARFVVTIFMYVLIFVPTLIVSLSVDNTLYIFMPTLLFAVCIVGQFLGDIMNVEDIFNNLFVTIVKRLVFFAVIVGATFFGSGIAISGSSWDTLMERNASFFSVGMIIASMFAAPIAYFAYKLHYLSHSKHGHRIENKRMLPLLFPIIYVADVVFSLIVALILINVNANRSTATTVLGIIVAAFIVGSIVISLVSETWVFEEHGKFYYKTSHTISIPKPKSEYDKFREKCANCVHVRDCYIEENTTWGDKRHAHYCNLTGKEIYGIYTSKCPKFEDRAR